MAAERWLPEHHFGSRHEVVVAAPPDRVYRVTRTLDLRGSLPLRLLFRLRGLPPSALSLPGIQRMGFPVLEEKEFDGFVLGLVGRPWRVRGELVRLTPAEFREWNEPGYAKAVWAFSFDADGEVTRLGTETRIRCTDRVSRRRFRVYWTLIRPFSGLIRREILRLARREAERDRAHPSRRSSSRKRSP